MSELDDARRRLLVKMLGTAGQAIITTTNRHYFTDDELVERHGGRVAARRLAGGRRGHASRRRTPAATAGTGRAVSKRSDLPRRLGDILTPALDRLVGSDEARAYAAWTRAVGEPVARGTRPKAFRRGQLTVECASSVWANELTYLGPQILRRMDELMPGHPVQRFRFVVGRLPAPDVAVGEVSETPHDRRRRGLRAGIRDPGGEGEASGPTARAGRR